MSNLLFEHGNPVFNVGDIVKVVRYTIDDSCYINRPMKQVLGNTIKVKYDCDDDRVCCTFVIDGKDYECWFLNDWLELVEKAKKPWNGKVVCIDSVFKFFTKGKIYNVTNGNLYDDSKSLYSYGLTECPNETIVANFIEYKGEA